MSKLVWAINVSLDGFADHTVGIGVDDDAGLVVFGRITYELMEAAWRNAREDQRVTKWALEFAEKLNAIPKVVFSRTLDRAGWDNTRLTHADMVGEVTRLKEQPGKNIPVDGISVARKFMRHGLVDEYCFVVHPMLAGEGRRLIDDINGAAILRLLDTKVLGSGVVVLHYDNRGIEN